MARIRALDSRDTCETLTARTVRFKTAAGHGDCELDHFLTMLLASFTISTLFVSLDIPFALYQRILSLKIDVNSKPS